MPCTARRPPRRALSVLRSTTIPCTARRPPRRALSRLRFMFMRVWQLNAETKLPSSVPDKFAEDEPFLLALHHALMCIEIIDGKLVCPETQKTFPIKDGIPSMI